MSDLVKSIRREIADGDQVFGVLQVEDLLDRIEALEEAAYQQELKRAATQTALNVANAELEESREKRVNLIVKLGFQGEEIKRLREAIKDEIDKWPVENTDHPLYKALEDE